MYDDIGFCGRVEHFKVEEAGGDKDRGTIDLEVSHNQEGALHEVDVVSSLFAWLDIELNLVVVCDLPNKDVTSQNAHNQVDHVGT